MSIQAYSSHSQTRQQLDELDSLLQRMLDLPMRPEASSTIEPISSLAQASTPLPRLEVSGEPLPPAWRMAPPMPGPVATPPAASVEAAPPGQFAEIAPYPYSMVYGEPVVENLPPFAEPVGGAPAETAATSGHPWAIPAPGPQPGRSIVLLPLVILNRIFDILTYLLGPAGAWLRQGWGRTAMGWLGIVMILGAIGWALVDSENWTGLSSWTDGGEPGWNR